MATAARRISDATKTKAVKSLLAGTPARTLMRRLRVSDASIYGWAADKRYGGKPGGMARHKANGANPRKAKSGNGLATRAKADKPKSAYHKPRSPVATQHACPWCGMPLKVAK